MAAESGTPNLDVSRSCLGEALRGDPGRFEFFQAVRLVHRLRPGRDGIGRFAPPAGEALRFSVCNQLAFPASQIASFRWRDDGQAQMQVNFMGLTGPMGVLPHNYTELIQERKRAKDRSLEDFFDLFHHRILSLFYQAWEKYRFYVPYERGEADGFSNIIRSFAGIGTPGLERRQAVCDESILYYCGLFSLQARSATALQQILRDYFDAPVEIEQFVGSWQRLEPEDQCCMEGDAPYSNQLGMGAVVGGEVWDLQSRARIRLGPLTAAQYLSFLPEGDAWESLRAIATFFAGGEIEYEVQLVLQRGEVPPCALGAEGDEAPRLGWFSWIKSGAGFGRDPEDAVLLLN